MKKDVVRVERIINYLNAGYSGFIVKTLEPKRAEQIILKVIKDSKESYKPVTWDIDSAKTKNPEVPITNLTEDRPNDTIVILHNFHWFIDKPQMIQKIQNSMEQWKAEGKAIIIVTPTINIPVELKKDFMLLELPLPQEEEIKECMFYIAKSAGKDEECLSGDSDENNAIVQSAKGLSRTEIENVLALSLIEKGVYDIGIINEQKIQTIEKSGLIEILKTDKKYSDLLGYDKIKTVVSKMIKKRSSKGVMIVGPPGCGKTTFMQCTVGEFNRIGLLINFGRLYSKFQGEGFEQVEEVIDIIEAIGDCIVIMDEFEKQFAGAASTGDTDSGVSRRMTGRWLQFMQEKPEGVYMMATLNSFKGVPDEYLRPGRWDSSPFYIDIPNDMEREAILSHYVNKLQIDMNGNNIPPMPNWTGAEIEACCLMAKNLECSIADASTYIVPQNKRGFAEAEEIKKFSIPASDLILSEKSRKTRKINV